MARVGPETQKENVMTSRKPTIAWHMLGVAALLATSAAWSADKIKSNGGDGWAQQAQIQAAAHHDHGARAGLSSLPAIKPGPQALLFGSEAPAGSTSRVVDVAPVDDGQMGKDELHFRFCFAHFEWRLRLGLSQRSVKSWCG